MSTTYRLFLSDEFDWEYKQYKGLDNPNRIKVIELMKDSFKGKIPLFEVIADFKNWIIIDCGKWFPHTGAWEYADMADELLSYCDVCYAQRENDLTLEKLK